MMRASEAVHQMIMRLLLLVALVAGTAGPASLQSAALGRHAEAANPAVPALPVATALIDDVGTHTTWAPAATLAPTARMKKSAVDPVPSPTRMPDCTNLAAYSPAVFLSRSSFMRANMAFLPCARKAFDGRKQSDAMTSPAKCDTKTTWTPARS